MTDLIRVQPPRCTGYRLTSQRRWGTLVFTIHPVGSPDWYLWRAHRIATFDDVLGTRRSRRRAHGALLKIARHVRVQAKDPGVAAELRDWALRVRLDLWPHDAWTRVQGREVA